MVDANAWTPEIGNALAAREGMQLTERHWVVLNYCRAEWKAKGEAPTLRAITKNTDVHTKELYQFFPGGPGKLAAKVAGSEETHRLHLTTIHSEDLNECPPITSSRRYPQNRDHRLQGLAGYGLPAHDHRQRRPHEPALKCHLFFTFWGWISSPRRR